MNRTDIINRAIAKRGYKSYLELGVFMGENISLINCQHKVGVDAGFHFKSPHVSHFMTTDEFYAVNKETFDCIFIDANHDAAYVCRDLNNSLKFLNAGGTIFLHDCFPPDKSHCQSHLCSDSFKVICSLIKHYSDIVYCRVFDTDYGVGIVRKLKADATITYYDESFSWEMMMADPSKTLNLTPIKDVDLYV